MVPRQYACRDHGIKLHLALASSCITSRLRIPSPLIMSSAASTSEKPFKVAVPDAEIELLQKKLALVRFPDELNGAGWDYGSPLADVKRLTEHWKSGFDWRKAEASINTLPMFTRDIEVDGFGTLNVHYVHQVSDVKNAIPLLFVHGCELPSSCAGYR